MLRDASGQVVGSGGEKATLRRLSVQARDLGGQLDEKVRSAGHAPVGGPGGAAGQMRTARDQLAAIEKETKNRSEHMGRADSVMKVETELFIKCAETMDLKWIPHRRQRRRFRSFSVGFVPGCTKYTGSRARKRLGCLVEIR